MTSEVTITLPWPPTVNTYWRHIVNRKTGRVVVLLSESGRKYQSAVRAAVFARWPDAASRQPESRRLAMSIVVNAPDRRARDLDNLGKGILDGLAHAGLYVNDSQIDRLEFIRSDVIGKPGSVDVTMKLI